MTGRINTAVIDARIRPVEFLTDERLQARLPEQHRFPFMNLLAYVVKLNATNDNTEFHDGEFDPVVALSMVPGLTEDGLDEMVKVGLVHAEADRMRLDGFELFQTSRADLLTAAGVRDKDAERKRVGRAKAKTGVVVPIRRDTPQDAELDSYVDRFLKVYPKSVNHAAVPSAFAAEIAKGADPEKIVAAAEAYDRDHGELKYVPEPANWLAKQKYNVAVAETKAEKYQRWWDTGDLAEAVKQTGWSYERPYPPEDFASWDKSAQDDWWRHARRKVIAEFAELERISIKREGVPA